MAQDFGNGVSRTLSAIGRQFEVVVWQADKPPLDSELNLMGQVEMERTASVVRSAMHSGFLTDPLVSDTDFVTDASYSNRFLLGRQAANEQAPILWANVNGWVIPVTGTLVPDGETGNQINLFPPPSSDVRIDLVFLEVWLAQVAPNPSALNKPSASTIWKYGNTLFGGTNFPDDLEDPTVGFETTERVQVQYRLRVYGSGSGLGASVDLSRYPDGLGDPNVLGRGANVAPVGGFSFTNMRDELGDPSLWRAGDGDANNALGTVDGYTYAIPVCAVFRRNTQPFVAVNIGGNAQQNGSINRNPLSVPVVDPADGATTFGTLTLTANLAEGFLGNVAVTGLTGSGFDNPNLNWANTFIVIDNEILGVASVNTGANTIQVSSRGRWGTQDSPHNAGSRVQFFNWRQDGLFADQIANSDILDLRRSVSLGEWDYHQLLVGNLSRLFRNQMRTSYKQSGVTGGDVEGTVIPEVDSLFANGAVAVPNQTEALDGPDGIRTVFSDAAVAQSDVTVLLDAPAAAGAVANFTSASSWEIAADFVPDGFGTAVGWSNGDSINLYIGGTNGNSGARRTVRSAASNRIVRFLSPKEMWLSRDNDPTKGRQTPVTLRFIGSSASVNTGGATDPAAGNQAATDHPGPVYPLPEYNFEKPFIVLGGVVNTTLAVTGTVEAYPASLNASGLPEIRLPGVNFNTAGVYYPSAGVDVDDPAACSQPLLHGTRTLWSMLTANGTDLSGKSSEIYLVLSGNIANATTVNGVFRVIGAGTVGYTTVNGAGVSRVVVEFIREVGGPSDFPGAVAITGLTAVVRSQYTHTEDDSGRVSGPSALTVVLTDIEGTTGGSTNPWGGLITTPVNCPVVVNTTVQYGPSRGGMARVADTVNRFALINASVSDTFVRNSPSEFDAAFPVSAAVPDDETYFPPQPVQTWNRLSSLGLNAPYAPAYGGLRAAFTEQDREAELFVDGGSKTIVFRPLVRREMSVVRRNVTAGVLIPGTYPNTHAVDPEGFFSNTRGYPLPPEVMPRFGRQDIPVHLVDPLAPAAGNFLFGVNHLFVDTTDNTDSVFNIATGGDNNGSNPSMFLQTDPVSTLDYGDYGGIPGGGSGYQGRLFADVNIVSSEGGQGMKGIQLPPFLGVVRLYAVYDARDWNGVSAFAPDRVTPNPAGAPNLLRTDVDKQTLYFLQGGASDFTGNANDHTYIVPENVIDIRRSNSFAAGETFSDLHYVVEFMAFGFARGFVNSNNYVLARTVVPPGPAPLPASNLISDLKMVVNAAAKYPTQAYVGYTRTVYQGDPYMSRAGSVRVTSDYQRRYGQVPVPSAVQADVPIQQYDLAGNQIPETPNVRPLEVLASVDFYTTLGTGKIGGRVYAGTPLDVGSLASVGTRVPTSATASPFQTEPRVFTAGQSATGPRASLTVLISDNALTIAGNTVTLTRGPYTVTFTGGVDFTGGSLDATARSLALVINSNDIAQNLIRVYAEVLGQAVRIVAAEPGASGNDIRLSITPRSGLALYGVPYGRNASQSYFLGGEDVPANGTANGYAATPVELTGLTERLPLGILVQDSDFVGEDPLHDGTSILASRVDAVNLAANFQAPMRGQQEYNRMVGGAGSYIALADGSILEYTPYNAILSPTGARSFRLFRGGGSAYVIGTGTVPGGPVEFSAGALPEGLDPVLKGAVLVGKALLVRNYREEAFAVADTTTDGDEIQMVVVTQAVIGEGHPCGYTLAGEISPTGYGEGYAAADRYRLVGKPMSAGHSRMAPPTDVPLAPYPAVDPNEPDPCA